MRDSMILVVLVSLLGFGACALTPESGSQQLDAASRLHHDAIARSNTTFHYPHIVWAAQTPGLDAIEEA